MTGVNASPVLPLVKIIIQSQGKDQAMDAWAIAIFALDAFRGGKESALPPLRGLAAAQTI
jgi:hypothetical protein